MRQGAGGRSDGLAAGQRQGRALDQHSVRGDHSMVCQVHRAGVGAVMTGEHRMALANAFAQPANGVATRVQLQQSLASRIT